jgi:hypothetical protein
MRKLPASIGHDAGMRCNIRNLQCKMCVCAYPRPDVISAQSDVIILCKYVEDAKWKQTARVNKVTLDPFVIFSSKLSFELNEWQRATCNTVSWGTPYSVNLYIHLLCHKNVSFTSHLNIILATKNKYRECSTDIPKTKWCMHYLLIFVLNSDLKKDGRKNEVRFHSSHESPLQVAYLNPC